MCDNVYHDPASHTQATYEALAESAELGEGKCECGGARFVTKRHGATFKLIPTAKFYDFRIEDSVQRMLMREDAPIHDSGKGKTYYAWLNLHGNMEFLTYIYYMYISMIVL
jgi:hypothetical protein